MHLYTINVMDFSMFQISLPLVAIDVMINIVIADPFIYHLNCDMW